MIRSLSWGTVRAWTVAGAGVCARRLHRGSVAVWESGTAAQPDGERPTRRLATAPMGSFLPLGSPVSCCEGSAPALHVPARIPQFVYPAAAAQVVRRQWLRDFE